MSSMNRTPMRGRQNESRLHHRRGTDGKGPASVLYIRRAHNSPDTAAHVAYENLVKMEYKAQAGLQFPDDAMLSVRIFAYLSIPKSVSKKKRTAMLEGLIRPTKKPDHDNIGKIVCDALNGIAYRDDAQIVDSLVRKFYSDKPCVLVEISDIPYKT